MTVWRMKKRGVYENCSVLYCVSHKVSMLGLLEMILKQFIPNDCDSLVLIVISAFCGNFLLVVCVAYQSCF